MSDFIRWAGEMIFFAVILLALTSPLWALAFLLVRYALTLGAHS
jgi:hypothetical protein